VLASDHEHSIQDCGFKPSIPWPNQRSPELARRMVATILTSSESSQTAQCALDFWCYMHDEEDVQNGPREYLCLAGNLWIIPPNMKKDVGEESESNIPHPYGAPQGAVSVSILKSALCFNAFSKCDAI
jgi:hypothetical protein